MGQRSDGAQGKPMFWGLEPECRRPDVQRSVKLLSNRQQKPRKGIRDFYGEGKV